MTLLRIRGTRPTAMTGAAGEYFVAAELSMRGWLATVTIKNSPGVDVLAQRLDSSLSIAVQTKTASRGNSFQLNQKCEGPSVGEHDWYVLVQLQEKGQEEPKRPPRFFVIPRNVVAGAVYATHREWLATPGRRGQAHNDTSRRNLWVKDVANYEDAWDLLLAPTSGAPLVLDPRFDEAVKNHGLPKGHPGWPKRPQPTRK